MFFRPHKNIRNLTDEELVSRYAATRHNGCAEALIDRHFHPVFGVCLKYLKNEERAKEAAFIIFEKLLNEAVNLQIKNINAWLHTVSRNYCLTSIRNTQRAEKGFLKVELREEIDLSEEEQEDNQLYEIRLDKLEEAIKDLKDEQQACIKLFYLQEKSYKEITEITGYDTKQVKSYIQNGKRTLKLILEKANGI